MTPRTRSRWTIPAFAVLVGIGLLVGGRRLVPAGPGTQGGARPGVVEHVASGEGAASLRRVAPEEPRAPAPRPAPEDPPVTWPGDEPPPDPLERGPATLHLALRDTESGEPLASRVELWRIDAAGNDWWTRGDQLQARLDVPPEGLAIAELPEGVYRIVPHEQPRSDEPLAAFEVHAPSTVVTFELRRRGSFEVWLHLVDRQGAPMTRSLRRRVRYTHASDDEPWLVRRTSRDPRWAVGRGSGGGSRSSSHGRKPVAGRGYSLGRWSQPSRGPGGTSALVADVGSGSRVEIDLDARPDGDLHVTAVYLDAGEVMRRVLLPEGPRPSGFTLEVTALAVPWDPQGAGQEWRAAPVRIEVAADGYAAWRGAWRPLDGELPWIELEALE